jgi:hypothetical protein
MSLVIKNALCPSEGDLAYWRHWLCFPYSYNESASWKTQNWRGRADLKIVLSSWAQWLNACNPTYSGDGDQGQPQQKVSTTSPKPIKSGRGSICLSSLLQGSINMRMGRSLCRHKCVNLLEKYKSKQFWSMAQVIECLPSKCEALRSTPNTKKKSCHSLQLFLFCE